MKKIHLPATCLVLCSILLCSTKLFAQSEQEAKQSVTKKLAVIQGLIELGNFGEAAKHMTVEARDSFAARQISSAVQRVEMSKQMKKQLGELVKHLGIEPTEELEAAIAKYGFDKLGIEKAMQGELRVTSSVIKPSDRGKRSTRPEPTESKAESHGDESESVVEDSFDEEILAILDKDDRRWDIVAEIAKLNTSRFATSASLKGEIEAVELGDKKNVAFVTLNPSNTKMRRDRKGGNASVFQMSVETRIPSTVIEMKNSSDGWMYAGVDAERTNKLASSQRPERWRSGVRGKMESGGSRSPAPKEKPAKKQTFGGDFDDFDQK